MGWMSEEMCHYSQQWKDIPVFSETSKPAQGPPSFIFSGNRGFCLLGSRDQGLEAYHCPPSTSIVTKLKMRWTVPLLHMACTGNTCLFNDYYLPYCEAVYSGRKVPKVWRNQLSSSSLFRPEDRNNRFPRRFGRFLPDYTASYTKSSSHESLEYQIRTLVFIFM